MPKAKNARSHILWLRLREAFSAPTKSPRQSPRVFCFAFFPLLYPNAPPCAPKARTKREPQGSKFVAWFESCLIFRCFFLLSSISFFYHSPTPRPLPLKDRAVFLSLPGRRRVSPRSQSIALLRFSRFGRHRLARQLCRFAFANHRGRQRFGSAFIASLREGGGFCEAKDGRSLRNFKF